MNITKYYFEMGNCYPRIDEKFFKVISIRMAWYRTSYLPKHYVMYFSFIARRQACKFSDRIASMR